MTRRSAPPRARGARLGRRAFTAGLFASTAVVTSGALMRTPGAQTPPLKIGVVLPRSGYLAKIGQENQRGYDVARSILRQAGGYPELEFIAGDTESDVPKSRAAAEKLIGDGVHMISGCFDSGQTVAVAQVTEQKGIPFVVNIAAAPAITEQGYKFVFRNFPTGGRIVADAFTLQKEIYQISGKTPQTVVVMHVNDTFGTSIRDGINALLPRMEMPYKIVEMISYDPRARDLSVEVAKAKGTGAELLWTVSRLNDAILLTREMIKQRWEPLANISSGPGYYEDQYLKTLGKNADYVISFVPWYDPNKAMARILIAEMEKLHPGIATDTNHVFSFEAALIAADAYKRAKSTNPTALQEALRATNITDNCSIGAGIRFNEKGHNEWVGNAGIQNYLGRSRVVVPAKSADLKLTFPVPGWRARA